MDREVLNLCKYKNIPKMFVDPWKWRVIEAQKISRDGILSIPDVWKEIVCNNNFECLLRFVKNSLAALTSNKQVEINLDLFKKFKAVRNA